MDELTVFEQGAHVAGRYEILQQIESSARALLVDVLTYAVRDSVDLRTRVLIQLPLPAEGAERKAFLDHFYAEGERLQPLVDPSLPTYAAAFVAVIVPADAYAAVLVIVPVVVRASVLAYARSCL